MKNSCSVNFFFSILFLFPIVRGGISVSKNWPAYKINISSNDKSDLTRLKIPEGQNSLVQSYLCPFDSFLNEIHSYHYSSSAGSIRTFEVSCLFYEDDKGQILKKKSCNSYFAGSPDPPNPDYNSKKSGKSPCSDSSFLGGFDVIRTKDDLLLGSICCETENPMPKNTSSCILSPKTKSTFEFHFTCPEGYVLQQISSEPEKNHRSFQFLCCPLLG